MRKSVCLLMVLGMLFLSPVLWGFKVQVGSFFEIDKIAYKNGRLILPATRRKYHNVRVLNRDTFEWLLSCKEQNICKQVVSSAPFRIEQIRPAQTRPNMWIADVAFIDKWLITFLLFKNENDFSLQVPKVFKFLDVQIQTQVLKELVAQVEKKK